MAKKPTEPKEEVLYESSSEGDEIFYFDELEELVDDFLDDFFNDEYEVVRFNINFLEDNNFTYQTKIDYMKLNRFLATAINTIKSTDNQIIDPLIVKFYKDIVYLNDFYKSFIIKSKHTDTVLKKFIKSVGGAEGIYARAERAINKGKNSRAPKPEELKEILVEAKDKFSKEFESKRDYYKSELKKIINTKTFYFDKTLWSGARRSRAIIDFFKKSSMDDKEDELSTKTFIKKFLKTIDISHSKDPEWHSYLQKVVKIMD